MLKVDIIFDRRECWFWTIGGRCFQVVRGIEFMEHRVGWQKIRPYTEQLMGWDLTGWLASTWVPFPPNPHSTPRTHPPIDLPLTSPFSPLSLPSLPPSLPRSCVCVSACIFLFLNLLLIDILCFLVVKSFLNF